MDLQKYIVVKWHGKEQVILFPTHGRTGEPMTHKSVWEYYRKNGASNILSAGFFSEDGAWVGGRSESLDLEHRPQDAQLLERFLTSPDREKWDIAAAMAKVFFRKEIVLAGL